MPTKLWHAVVAERRPLRIASWCGTVEESPRSPQRDSIASAIPPLALRPSSRFLSGFITKLATSTRITNHFTIPLTCIPLLFGKTCSRRRPSLAEISPYYRIHAKYIHLSSRVYTNVDYLHEFSPLKLWGEAGWMYMLLVIACVRYFDACQNDYHRCIGLRIDFKLCLTRIPHPHISWTSHDGKTLAHQNLITCLSS